MESCKHNSLRPGLGASLKHYQCYSPVYVNLHVANYYLFR